MNLRTQDSASIDPTQPDNDSIVYLVTKGMMGLQGPV